LDATVDPYAYFLTSTDEKRYHEALKARGLPSMGMPDIGHPFESIRHTIESPILSSRRGVSHVWDGCLIGYAGNELDSIHGGNHTKLPTFISSGGLDTFARQAYSRVAPTSVVFDAANFLGELHERLPSISFHAIKDSVRSFKGLGADYLNLAFGWSPFITEFMNAARALGRATQELSQQGVRVHRSYSVPMETTFADTKAPSNLSTDLRNGFYVPTGFLPSLFPVPKEIQGFNTPWSGDVTAASYNQRYAFKRRTRRMWFEGEFSSFYPLNFDPSSYFDRLNVLVNTKVTPEVLWNLTPWTWLADWTLRIGDNIRANQLRANDLLIMHYGYAMEETVYTTGSSYGLPVNGFNQSDPKTATMIATTTRKRRIRANPYGFGVGGASALTADQLAILGALALTKGPV